MKVQRAKLHIILHATGPLAHDVNQRPLGRKSRDCVTKARHGSESTHGSSVTNVCAKKPWKSKSSDEITVTTSTKLEWSAIRSELVLQSSSASLYPNCIYFETKLTHSFDPSLFTKAKKSWQLATFPSLQVREKGSSQQGARNNYCTFSLQNRTVKQKKFQQMLRLLKQKSQHELRQNAEQEIKSTHKREASSGLAVCLMFWKKQRISARNCSLKNPSFSLGLYHSHPIITSSSLMRNRAKNGCWGI